MSIKKTIVFTTGWMALLVLAVCVDGMALEHHLYRKQVGSQGHQHFELTYFDAPQNSVRVNSKEGLEWAWCDDAGATLRWQVNTGANGTDVDVVRQDNTLHLTGTLDGDKLNKTISLDNLPWYQILSWSLRGFLKSDRTSTQFWSLRPGTYKVFKMQVENLGVTTIEHNGFETPALLLRIRPTGLLASLWHGDYWFDPKSLVFLRFEAATGPPGSGKTRIEHVKSLAR